MSRNILVVDDEPNMRWVLSQALDQAGYNAQSAASGDAAVAILSRAPIDLLLLDLKLNGEDGLTILRRVRERWPDLLVIMLTAYGTVATTVEAMQLGAADVLRKPFDVEDVLFKLTRALERRQLQQELARLRSSQQQHPALNLLIGCEPVWLRLREQARQLASTDTDLVLSGEQGSGRRSLARALHLASRRAAAPLVACDLSAYRTGAYETVLLGHDGRGGAWGEAGSGSLLLSGLAAAPQAVHALAAQMRARAPGSGARLLLVAAPDEAIPADLDVVLGAQLTLPPLRERPGDVLLLARQFAGTCPISAQAVQLLDSGYRWPGNIAELRGIIERAALLAGEGPIAGAHLPTRLHEALDASGLTMRLPAQGVNLEQLEQTLIRQALARTGGNKSRAAELLGLTRHTLSYRMEKYAIA